MLRTQAHWDAAAVRLSSWGVGVVQKFIPHIDRLKLYGVFHKSVSHFNQLCLTGMAGHNPNCLTRYALYRGRKAGKCIHLFSDIIFRNASISRLQKQASFHSDKLCLVAPDRVNYKLD